VDLGEYVKLRNAGLGKNSEFTKRLNRQMVLDLLRREPTQSRADLARLTRLSPQSLSNMIDDLQRAGLIEASGKIYGGKGQPPTNYRIAADRGYGIGLHVDRDFIRAALVDFDFVQRFGMRRPLTARSVDGVKDILTDMINELIAAAAVPVDRIWGIGIASPRLRDAHVLDAPSLEGSFWSELHSYEIDRRLAEERDMAVIVENDANAGALAELTFGKGRSVRNFCYLLLGHGLGAGLVHDGGLFRGGWSNAGEIGRILVPHNGKTVYLEQIVSVEYLLDVIGASGSTRDSETGFARLVEAGNTKIETWLAEAAPHLRWLVGTLENMLDPETIILGSDLPEWLLDRLLEKVAPLAHTIASRDDRSAPRLQKGLLDRDMIALGAATMPLLATLEAQPAAKWNIAGEIVDVFHELD